MCIARRDTISGHFRRLDFQPFEGVRFSDPPPNKTVGNQAYHFQCHRNSDLTRLKEKAYLSVDFVYLSNVLKVFSIKCFSEENTAYSEGRFVINKLYFCHLRLLLC